MDSMFRDRKVKALVVEGSGAFRTLFAEVLRSQGFEDVQTVPSLKEAIGILEVEPVNWLISSVFPDAEENLMQVLKLSCIVPQLRELKISALVEANEVEVLPEAFSLGLLSYHMKPFTRDSLQTEIQGFLADFEKYQWNSLLYSSYYLRKCLMQISRFEDLLQFEKQLLKVLPGDVSQLLNLALPLIKLKRPDEAKQVLSQVLKLDSNLQKQVKAIASQHFQMEAIDTLEAATDILGIKNAVIVDNDSTVQNEIRSALNEMGVEDIKIFNDGETALNYLEENSNPDLILQEWRIPKITGPLFLQKAKETGAKTTPFIACSSLVEKSDIPFLREMGIAHVLKKPIQRNELIKGIAWTIQQDRRPTDKVALERKTRQFLADKNFEEAEKTIALYLSDEAIGHGPKQLLRAELAYAKGDYEKARDLSIDAMKQGGESILVLNLLGKAMLQLRVLETALKCFERAQELAPQNLERLCQMAEISAELGDEGKAEALLDKVDDMDPNGNKGDESRAKIALNKGDSKGAKNIMSQLESVQSVVAYMNNRAIAMARCGMVDEGIQQYRRTVEALPDNRPDIESVVWYNLALACIRNNNLDEAKECLIKPVHANNPKIKPRVDKLLARLKNAQAKGETLTLAKVEVASAATAAEGAEPTAEGGAGATVAATIAAGGDVDIGTNDKSFQAAALTIDNRAGDKGCYLIFQPNQKNADVAKMLEHNILFKVRKGINKDMAKLDTPA